MEEQTTTLQEGHVPDKATGKLVDIRKPEEAVRQEYETILRDNYDYCFEQMDIEVSIQRGERRSRKNRSERADIVVYKTADITRRNQSRDILGIVETKSPSKRGGLKQLESYMSATCCLWGVWTNGKQTEYVYRDVTTGEIKRDYIFQIPRKGETFEDIGRITKNDLRPVRYLKPVFRTIFHHLYANSNISSKEKLGAEMTRLIFCKIHDELHYQDKPPKFRVGINDTAQQVKENVEKLWEEVKNSLVDEGIFQQHEGIDLDAESVRKVVGELETFSLNKTDKDVIGDAFEVFAERQFAGEKGEFFTPRQVVKMAVEMLDPRPEEKVLDPACGSGGFLIYALEHVWKTMAEDPKYQGENLKESQSKIASRDFYGIDKEMSLVRICKAYMSIIGDGKSKVVRENSLKNPNEWEPASHNILYRNGRLRQYDVILTNPPFGRNIKIKDEGILGQYELAQQWSRQKEDVQNENGWVVKTASPKETEPQTLFIERCLDLLKDGGRMAIVLPDGVFGNPTDGYIREWIKDKAEILAVVDCPHNTFMPHTHTKTSVLLLRKWEGDKKENYPIMMSVVEKCGHDTRGREIYVSNGEEEVLDEEFSETAEIYRKNSNRVIEGFNRLGFTLLEQDLKDGILVPRYYNPDTVADLCNMENSGEYEMKTVRSLIDEGVLKIKGVGESATAKEYSIYDDIPFLRTSDIGCWEPRNDAVQKVDEMTYLKYKRKQDLQERDILFVKDGTYRIGESIILTKNDLRMLVQNHFLKIRSSDRKKLNPYLLLHLLHVPIVRRQIDERTFVQATLSTIGNRLGEVQLPIPKEKEVREKIAKEIRKRIMARAKAKKEIRNIFSQP